MRNDLAQLRQEKAKTLDELWILKTDCSVAITSRDQATKAVEEIAAAVDALVENFGEGSLKESSGPNLSLNILRKIAHLEQTLQAAASEKTHRLEEIKSLEANLAQLRNSEEASSDQK